MTLRLVVLSLDACDSSVFSVPPWWILRFVPSSEVSMDNEPVRLTKLVTASG